MKEKNKDKNQETEIFNDIMSHKEIKTYNKFLEEERKNQNNKKEEDDDDDINIINKKFEDEINRVKLEKCENQKIKPESNNSDNNTQKSETPKTNVGLKIIAIISFILSLAYLVFTIIFCKEQINNLFLIINASIITCFSLFLMLMIIIKKIKVKNTFGVFTTLFLSGFIILNFLVLNNIIEIPTQELLANFQNENITDALKWAKEHNIEVNQIYEYSDNIKEYHIISQDIYPNTLLKKVDEITFTVSYGPNYDKIISIPNMVGWNIDDALKIINENFLNNIKIDYEVNDEEKKDIILEQSTSGQIRRSDELKLKVSLGKKEDLEPVEMINLYNKSLLEATLWLKRYGIDYELKYSFSDNIPKNYVVGQETEEGETVNPKDDKVTIIISKGKKIVVPDLTKMSVDEVTEWIISNNLKVKFETKYDSTIKLGDIITADFKENDEIESGTLITVTTSKGSLKMPKFSNVTDFRNWANENGINYREEYEFNDDIKNGDIIKTVPEEDAVINYSDTAIIYISYGKPVEVPSLVGKSRSEIISICNNAGLNCTFYYNDYSNTPYDVAQNQNKTAGSKVVSGTYINIGLSKGPRPAEQPKPPTPTCNKNETEEVWLTPGNDGSQTKTNISGAYPNIKWNFKMVDNCNSGSSAAGEVCNASEIDGKKLNHCDTYTVIIVK